MEYPLSSTRSVFELPVAKTKTGRYDVGWRTPRASWFWEWSPDEIMEDEVLRHGIRDGLTVLTP